MNRGIATLADVLGAVKLDRPLRQPSVPAPTPKPERSKVVARPTREPVNRQAALVLAPARCWLSQPPPAGPDPNQHITEALVAVRNALQIERNHRARLADEIHVLRTANAAVRKDNERLRVELGQAQQYQALLEEEIKTLTRQLEQAKAVLRQP